MQDDSIITQAVLDKLTEEGCEPELAAAIANLVTKGEVYDSGEKRNGRTVRKKATTKH
jgi:hypothetical protein